MAHHAVLIVLLVFASPHIEARHSKFLTQPPAPAPGPAPTLAPVPAPAPAPAELEFGYGLYRHGSTITTANYVDDKESIVTGELASESYKEYNTDKSYNNNNNNDDRYGYDTNSYSDKHYFEKNRHFYDTPKYENYYQNGYEPVRRSSNNEGYYGNGENSKYVFDTMEEYERQEGYPKVQGEFIP